LRKLEAKVISRREITKIKKGQIFISALAGNMQVYSGEK
jgi:hypothetical protein